MTPINRRSISRRQFITYVGIGTYALLRGDASYAAKFPTRRQGARPKFFNPVTPSDADKFTVPGGFQSEVVISFRDPLGSTGPMGAELFGFDNDYVAYFPTNALTGGSNSTDGLLWVNHEFIHGLLVSGAKPKTEKTPEQIAVEKLVTGGSVVRVRKDQKGWGYLKDPAVNHRYCAAYPRIEFSGPFAETLIDGIGTLANCSGGTTPWNTVLTCEENYHLFNPENEVGWGKYDDTRLDERQYGWIVEVDPFKKLAPRKHSCLGRFAHENAALRFGKKDRLVVYMGDDSKDQYFYKYISAEKRRSAVDRSEQRKLLENGTLYAADFVNNRWLSLDLATNPKLKEAGFTSQADVLLETRKAAKAVGATPMDRPEDCEIHPRDGSVYISFTNNGLHGNAWGQIVRLVEKGDDAEAMDFDYEIFVTGGPQSGIAAPDNLLFDKQGNLWVCCDVGASEMRKSAYKTFANNGMFYVPTSGKDAGVAFQFASAPVDAELTGPCFTPDGRTLFVSVQHPGENTVDLAKPTSRWPGGPGTLPRSSVVAITGNFG